MAGVHVSVINESAVEDAATVSRCRVATHRASYEGRRSPELHASATAFVPIVLDDVVLNEHVVRLVVSYAWTQVVFQLAIGHAYRRAEVGKRADDTCFTDGGAGVVCGGITAEAVAMVEKAMVNFHIVGCY